MVDYLITHHQTAWNKETGSRHAIHQQQNTGCQQHPKGQQPQNGSHEPGPNGQGHPHQGHSLGSQVDGSGDEVQGSQQGRHAKDGNAENPQGLTRSQTRTRNLSQGTQGRVGSPSRYGRTSGDKESSQQNQQGQKSKPEREHVQDRECHIRSPDLDGQNVISKTTLRSSGQHEKDHQGPVHG